MGQCSQNGLRTCSLCMRMVAYKLLHQFIEVFPNKTTLKLEVLSKFSNSELINNKPKICY